MKETRLDNIKFRKDSIKTFIIKNGRTAAMTVTTQCLAFAQEFGREDDVLRTQLFAYAFRIPHGNGAFDDHYRMGIDFLH